MGGFDVRRKVHKREKFYVILVTWNITFFQIAFKLLRCFGYRIKNSEFIWREISFLFLYNYKRRIQTNFLYNYERRTYFNFQRSKIITFLCQWFQIKYFLRVSNLICPCVCYTQFMKIVAMQFITIYPIHCYSLFPDDKISSYRGCKIIITRTFSYKYNPLVFSTSTQFKRIITIILECQYI